MKNIFLIGAGLLVGGLAYILPSSAGVMYVPSEYQGDTYKVTSCPKDFVERASWARTGINPCYAVSQRKVRGFSDRKGPFSYRLSRVSSRPSSLTRSSVSLRRRTTGSSDPASSMWVLQYRATQRARLNLKQEDLSFQKEEVFQEQDQETVFDFQVPNGFVSKDGTYRNVNLSLAFRVKEVEGTYGRYVCVQPTFEFCAIDLGKEFRTDQNLASFSPVERNTSWRQEFYNKERVSVPVVTEMFSGSAFGTENVYLTFTTLNPRNGAVVRIEAVSLDKERDETVRVMNAVFKSFRFLTPSS